MSLAPGSRCAVASYRARNRWIDPRDIEQTAPPWLSPPLVVPVAVAAARGARGAAVPG
jgi:hypothetical protein